MKKFKLNLFASSCLVILIAIALNGCQTIADDEYDEEESHPVTEHPIPPTNPPTPPVITTKTDVMHFPVTVQIGAFKNRHLAEEFMNKAMVSLGRDFRLYEAPSGLFKIQMGTFGDLNSAMSTLSSARSSGYYDAFITEYR